MLESTEDSIKVIVVGDGNVGKTCMLRRFVRGEFTELYKKTIGTEFMEKDVFLRSSNTTVKLMLWDTAGQEVFSSLTQAYYRGSSAAVLAFSTVDRDSFIHIEQWKQKVESVCGPITMVLCQTKVDLSHEASTTSEEAEKLAQDLHMPLFRVSSKDDFNITQLFEFTAQQCVGSSEQKEEAVERVEPSAEVEQQPTEKVEETNAKGQANATAPTTAVPKKETKKEIQHSGGNNNNKPQKVTLAEPHTKQKKKKKGSVL
ncbi:Rab family, other [Angomonas deanei]|nr:Rab family, other [Angomonas deanei]|eukprot:EPY42810.1 Rab family, other [Angomonas deanei]